MKETTTTEGCGCGRKAVKAEEWYQVGNSHNHYVIVKCECGKVIYERGMSAEDKVLSKKNKCEYCGGELI